MACLNYDLTDPLSAGQEDRVMSSIPQLLGTFWHDGMSGGGAIPVVLEIRDNVHESAPLRRGRDLVMGKWKASPAERGDGG